ncbi:hypothetical protein COCMIDRAFT_24095 [Bipolaris oryzae ATCC 44560]|uniref:Uncharacterized protein n=1 Tax=Bipolaris oryzae ATCC 44560 TaxID=930090 RepID=W6ZW44_COCMI|nr:uncharacterized protein COCMIDRAFT_24095 [Bipolaris oryzae ATCC 44560]EUC48041.1 hypothetical protein COCMIDRAFT_24095 [Bipolaris oryzae ATCC 44560]
MTPGTCGSTGAVLMPSLPRTHQGHSSTGAYYALSMAGSFHSVVVQAHLAGMGGGVKGASKTLSNTLQHPRRSHRSSDWTSSADRIFSFSCALYFPTSVISLQKNGLTNVEVVLTTQGKTDAETKEIMDKVREENQSATDQIKD